MTRGIIFINSTYFSFYNIIISKRNYLLLTYFDNKCVYHYKFNK